MYPRSKGTSPIVALQHCKRTCQKSRKKQLNFAPKSSHTAHFGFRRRFFESAFAAERAPLS